MKKFIPFITEARDYSYHHYTDKETGDWAVVAHHGEGHAWNPLSDPSDPPRHVVGTITGFKGPHPESMHVHPAHRRHGVATQLTLHAIKHHTDGKWNPAAYDNTGANSGQSFYKAFKKKHGEKFKEVRDAANKAHGNYDWIDK